MNFLKLFFKHFKRDTFIDACKLDIPVDEKNDYCIESKFDNRDYYVSAGEEEESRSIAKDLRAICPPIRNQKTLGSCASHGIITCYESELIKKNKYVEFSELYHYYNARRKTNNQDKNVGMTMSQACRTIKKNGLAFEKYWPYEIKKFAKVPSLINYWVNKLLNKMSNYNVDSYYLVNDTDDAMMWLDKDVVVMAGVRMFPKFNKAYGKKRLLLDDIKGVNLKKMGGHCVNIVGYNNVLGMLLIRNSWGKRWGFEGHIWIDFDVWEKICFEMRTIIV